MNKPAPKKKSVIKKKDHSAGYSVSAYNQSKKVDPLADKYPRYKGGKWSLKTPDREEVRNELYPFIEDFVKTRIKWRKMPKLYHNDSRLTLTQFFIGKEYPSLVWRNGKQVKKMIKYAPSAQGKLIFDTLREEIDERFSTAEVLNTLIGIIYKNRIDHYTLSLKPFVNTKPDTKAVSIWDKISENVQV